MLVVPKDVVAANGDVVPLGELDHGVRYRVIDMALCLLGAVPLHFVLESGGVEAGAEPVLVWDVVENVAVDGAADWETWPPLLQSDGCIGKGIAFSVDCLDFHSPLAMLPIRIYTSNFVKRIKLAKL